VYEFDFSIRSRTSHILIHSYCSAATGIDTYSRTILGNLRQGQKVTIGLKD
jgi:hypothetical protein